jgi:hypothetical protein
VSLRVLNSFALKVLKFTLYRDSVATVPQIGNDREALREIRQGTDKLSTISEQLIGEGHSIFVALVSQGR